MGGWGDDEDIIPNRRNSTPIKAKRFNFFATLFDLDKRMWAASQTWFNRPGDVLDTMLSVALRPVARILPGSARS